MSQHNDETEVRKRMDELVARLPKHDGKVSPDKLKASLEMGRTDEVSAQEYSRQMHQGLAMAKERVARLRQELQEAEAELRIYGWAIGEACEHRRS
jgi:hypothetical protein